MYVPQVGYQFSIGQKSFIDAGVRYEGTTSFDENSAYAKLTTLV